MVSDHGPQRSANQMLSECSEGRGKFSGRFLKMALSLEGWTWVGTDNPGWWGGIGKIRGKGLQEKWVAFITSGGEMFLGNPHLLVRCCHAHCIS